MKCTCRGGECPECLIQRVAELEERIEELEDDKAELLGHITKARKALQIPADLRRVTVRDVGTSK